MDWMTLTITLVCGVIFVSFVVIPIGEFRQIFRAIRARGSTDAQPNTSAHRTEGR